MISNIKYNIAILIFALFSVQISFAGIAAIFPLNDFTVCILVDNKIQNGEGRTLHPIGGKVVNRKLDSVKGTINHIEITGIGHYKGKCTIHTKEKILVCNKFSSLPPSTKVEIKQFPGRGFGNNVPEECGRD